MCMIDIHGGVKNRQKLEAIILNDLNRFRCSMGHPTCNKGMLYSLYDARNDHHFLTWQGMNDFSRFCRLFQSISVNTCSCLYDFSHLLWNCLGRLMVNNISGNISISSCRASKPGCKETKKPSQVSQCSGWGTYGPKTESRERKCAEEHHFVKKSCFMGTLKFLETHNSERVLVYSLLSHYHLWECKAQSTLFW